MLQQWNSFREELYLYVAARLPASEHDMQTRLNELLGEWGGHTTLNGSMTGTLIGKCTY